MPSGQQLKVVEFVATQMATILVDDLIGHHVDQSIILDYVRHLLSLLSLFEMPQSQQTLVADLMGHPVEQSVIPLDILARLFYINGKPMRMVYYEMSQISIKPQMAFSRSHTYVG